MRRMMFQGMIAGAAAGESEGTGQSTRAREQQGYQGQDQAE